MVIGVVCALRPEKGLGTLMEAFRKVKAGGRGVKLVIVGSGPMLAELAGGGAMPIATSSRRSEM